MSLIRPEFRHERIRLCRHWFENQMSMAAKALYSKLASITVRNTNILKNAPVGVAALGDPTSPNMLRKWDAEGGVPYTVYSDINYIIA